MVESCTIFNLLVQLSLSSGDMETLPFMNSTFPKRLATLGVIAMYMHTALKQTVAILQHPPVPPKGKKIWRRAKIIKFHILQILERINQLVPIMVGGESMASSHPPLVGWSDIHLSNYHLSIRAQFTITTYYLMDGASTHFEEDRLQINRTNSEAGPSWRFQ